jgi:hypothetical protein
MRAKFGDLAVSTGLGADVAGWSSSRVCTVRGTVAILPTSVCPVVLAEATKCFEK